MSVTLILTLIEFVVERQLKQQGETLHGLFPGNPKRATARPTTERILKAFKPITLTIMKVSDQEYGHVTPLDALQQKILQLLELPPDIYASLESSPDEC
jgi:transposase